MGRRKIPQGMRQIAQAGDEHLAALLEGARSSGTSPREARVAFFQLIDYYQAILRMAARSVARDLEGWLGLEVMNVVLAALPGLSGETKGRLDRLRKLRNALVHNEDLYPEERVHRDFLDSALLIRGELESQTEIVRQRLEGLEEFPLEVEQMAIEAEILSSWVSDDAELRRLLAWATRVTSENSSLIRIDDIREYAALFALVERANAAQEADYEDQAQMAKADDYESRNW